MPDALAVMRREHTQVVANEQEVQTAEFTRNPDASIRKDDLLAKLAASAGADNVVTINAHQVAAQLLGDPIGANILLMGFAWQKGLVPVGLPALMRAIELNQVAVDMNKRAFHLGRLAAADKNAIARLANPQAQVIQFTMPASLDDSVALRSGLLVKYQNEAYAARYRDAVENVRQRELAIDPKTPVTKAVARSLFKLMAYKDEYEVARMHADPAFLQQIGEQFEGGFKLEYHLAPPLLARKRPGSDVPAKMRLGGWMLPVFRALAPLKVLRGTPLDVFGFTAERRMERVLRDDYFALVDMMARELTAANKGVMLKLAQVPEQIRGYGHIKLANVKKAKAEEASLRRVLESAPVAELRASRA